jgi:hypothetical protein
MGVHEHAHGGKTGAKGEHEPQHDHHAVLIGTSARRV